MYSGTSTGAVIVGGKSAGMTAEQILKFYCGRVIEGFKDRQKHWYNPTTWGKPVFSYNFFRSLLEEAMGDLKFGDTSIPTSITAYGLRKSETHFIKSWDKYDAQHKLVDVISWSALSAAHYFGKINSDSYKWDSVNCDGSVDEHVGESFQDGGQGTNNCTVMYDLVESFARLMGSGEDVAIISFGCGNHKDIRRYSETSKTSMIAQALAFPFQARRESTPLQVGAARYVAAHNPRIKFVRLDADMPKEALEFGSFKYVNTYYDVAKRLVKLIPYEYFK
jgi:hypothetical protein